MLAKSWVLTLNYGGAYTPLLSTQLVAVNSMVASATDDNNDAVYGELLMHMHACRWVDVIISTCKPQRTWKKSITYYAVITSQVAPCCTGGLQVSRYDRLLSVCLSPHHLVPASRSSSSSSSSSWVQPATSIIDLGCSLARLLIIRLHLVRFHAD